MKQVETKFRPTTEGKLEEHEGWLCVPAVLPPWAHWRILALIMHTVNGDTQSSNWKSTNDSGYSMY